MNSLFDNWTSTLRRNSLLLVLAILLVILGINSSIIAAERIYATFSAIERSISVTDLEKYAEDGIINKELAFYQQYLPTKQFQELQGVLLTPVKVSPDVASQFLYTPEGEFLLHRLAQVIQPESRQAQGGFHALRSALISATAEPGGLTLLNLLRKYPYSSIHIDLRRSFAIVRELEKVINQTQRAIAAVTKQSNIEAATIAKPLNLLQLADLRNPGQFHSQKHTLRFFDSKRDRLLLTDVYIPHVQTPAPVIVISHGLGTDSSNFEYLATHLASHGLAVVVPNHPGSSAKQLQTSLHKQTSQVIEPDEFIDQPLDIKYVLNQLEKINQSDSRFQNRLNLQQVGIFGQSLGGYTALALAGAKINFQQLAQNCTPEVLQKSWNMSLLFQCSALELSHNPNQDYNLQDHRIKAAIAVNPITSSIFGKAGLNQIKIPIMIVSSSADTVAPALYEQIQPFSWLTNSQKYLVMLLGGTHFSTIGDGNPGSQQVSLPTDLVGDASQAREYMNVLSLPFFQTYVSGNSQYLPYLNAAYTNTISHKSLGLSLVQSLNQTELAQALTPDSFKQKFPNPIVNFGFWMLNIGIAIDIDRI
ncbi:alpha/beta hydrolase [Nodularia spumigena CS-586/05]|uniref:alpha/beta hydrolase n=1 Tax=Nodularia spumigena TaxID=70799 RepID=UPI00232F3B86|nr:alpha/beta hydrolase [Nodularia spumigena]MDB9321768.1 alpha/beta hydrolase [Nodularia spumigena CS-591/07A]MDB9331599.1 alpha/beta hydrolase [Nodularia spumigena CS-591/04]MDB9342975.1 alpha/beta hydrolase [Nodularia spumigena CS-588/06]MDB9350289.1 alpha/beta hydrolase [Nodularia spumigena CS-588/01]MDB9352271.1 alpha/beta hydrolase [Nodularia spumigena CS-588/05]